MVVTVGRLGFLLKVEAPKSYLVVEVEHLAGFPHPYLGWEMSCPNGAVRLLGFPHPYLG